MQLAVIKEFTSDLPKNDDTKFIIEKVSEFLTISQSDFQYYTWKIPLYLLFLLLLVGLVA